VDGSRSLLPEDLCWEIAGGDTDLGASRPSEEILQAYRSGRLSEEEERRLEWQLAHSGAARRRLVALAEVDLPEPSAAVRESVLTQVGRPQCAGDVVTANRLVPVPRIFLVKP
jgi:hypothetical protein